jgi:hypothetical protein
MGGVMLYPSSPPASGRGPRGGHALTTADTLAMTPFVAAPRSTHTMRMVGPGAHPSIPSRLREGR